ncbi:xanthine dehydrogenase molybdopterin binding subunit [Vibrio sp. JC009]|uniref:xanthine dehydrogenase molybdopterin binding subunit n=1 Tax=Vibrio sp. JC009 TaxID=2912314 RepID=UPI0023B116F4|nr:xanthine dehydrogenase molybdopterin binding subunit [Vibrio sp. JC009]WED22880.1 xanthine dehydrogenase molybdopterin binding subunit [Vibrio sp. JC009]
MKRRVIQIIGQAGNNKFIGCPLKHESAEKQVTGKAVYVDDYAVSESCLHAAVICADIAKGEILSADFSKVKLHAGVVAVYSESDIPGLKDIGTLDCGDPLLSDGSIRFHSQAIALVLAKGHKQAWRASELAEITYKKQTSATDYATAKNKPPLISPCHIGAQVSDSEIGDCDIRLEGTISTGGQEHFYLEGQVSLAESTEDGGIFIQTSSQNPSEVQKMIAKVLDIPFNKVVVDTRRIGGGFGGKESNATQWACLAALGSSLSGKMVKIRLPRSVDMEVTGKRHPFVSHYQLGTNKDGVIQHCRLEMNALCGHSPDLSQAIMERAILLCDNAYFLNHASITGKYLRTDTVSNTAFRGFGAPQAAMLIEKAMQDLSIRTGQDALDVRLKNRYQEGKELTHYGMQVEQHQVLSEVFKTLEKSSGYRKRRQEINQWNLSNPVIKKGLALTPIKFGIAFTATFLNQAGGLIHIYTDGSVQVSHGGTEMGQGINTKIQQIVAEALGIPAELILVTSTRTDKVPNTSPTAASSSADLNGMAVYKAAQTIKKRLLEFATEHFQLSTPPRITDGLLVTETEKLEWTKFIQLAYINRVSLSATGFYKTPKVWYDREKGEGHPFYYFSIGAACSEVKVDTLTGEMKVTRTDIIQDVGNSLNPAIDTGQIEGAFIQGMGWLTTEELIWDKDGKLLTNTPASYKIPTIGDYPDQMNITLYNNANPEHSIYHSKAIGEPPFLLAISVWCAIYDAVASISNHKLIPELNTPATSEQILKACVDQHQKMAKDENE